MIHSSARDSITVETEQVLIEKYDRLYRLAYSYVHNEDDALDIVQESACKAIYQCNSLKDSYEALCLDLPDCGKHHYGSFKNQEKRGSSGELPEQASEDVYQETDLKNALESLEPQNRTIVILRYCEDMKLEDIALAVNENLNTVKTRLYRSLKKLRINLEAPDTN